jgi:4'-phosphopantetheinyl transferase
VAGVAHVGVALVARVLDDVPASPADWLSESELARLATLRHAGRRDQYLAGHWLARQLLLRRFDAPCVLLERRSLPPAVQGHEATRHVSISHGADWIAAAASDVAIGIDLEQRPRVLDAAIAPLLLEPGEALGDVDADTLLRRWVAKEAWLKRGCGKALPERLRQLRLGSVAPAQADVVVGTHAAWHLAVAVAPGSRVELPAGLAAGAAFAVWEPL